jgi:hypothetical protein
MDYGTGNGDLYTPGSHPAIPTASAPSPTPPPADSGAGGGGGGGGGAGGYTPDYTSLIQNDPAYIAAVAANKASASAGEATRRAALRRAYIMYGGDLPSGFKDRFGDLNRATLDAAGVNENSVIANLARSFQQNTEQFHRSLSARGALQSGDLNYGADQLQRGNEQQRYDAGNQFLDQANQYYGQYQDVLNQNADRLVGAIQAAEGNVYNNPAYRPSYSDPGTTPVDGSSAATPTSNVVWPGSQGYATYHAGASAMAGQPVYQDGQGNLYDQRGNPFRQAA